MESLKSGGLAVVVGATGGIGEAMVEALQQTGGFARVTGFSRASEPDIDLTDEQTILRAAAAVKDSGLDLRLVFDATGFLHGCGFKPEKTLSAITPSHMAHAFAINALGPALLMKHFLPLLAKDGKSVFATLSAKVGSIGDNALGGGTGLPRVSKAALQFVRSTARRSILARKRPGWRCGRGGCILAPSTPGCPGHLRKRRCLMVRTAAWKRPELLLGVSTCSSPSRRGVLRLSRRRPAPW